MLGLPATKPLIAFSMTKVSFLDMTEILFSGTLHLPIDSIVGKKNEEVGKVNI